MTSPATTALNAAFQSMNQNNNVFSSEQTALNLVHGSPSPFPFNNLNLPFASNLPQTYNPMTPRGLNNILQNTGYVNAGQNNPLVSNTMDVRTSRVSADGEIGLAAIIRSMVESAHHLVKAEEILQEILATDSEVFHEGVNPDSSRREGVSLSMSVTELSANDPQLYKQNVCHSLEAT